MKNKIIISCIIIVFIFLVVMVIARNISDKAYEKTTENANEQVSETEEAKEVIEKYIEAMSSFDFDQIIDLADAKASYAWISCNEDSSKFLECYNEVTEEQTEEYQKQIEEMYNQTKEDYESYNFYSDDYDIEITEFTECELVENIDHLVKVAINVDIIVGGENSSESTLSFYVYDGKIIITSISE